jgi:hypothetical protein
VHTSTEVVHRQGSSADACADAAQFRKYFPVSASPFCLEQIRITNERLRHELEAATLDAMLKASELANVELFCLVAQNAPETLPKAWALVYDMVVSEERFWVYPKMTVAQIEEGLGEWVTPYMDRAKLAAEWRELLEHVQRVQATQESAGRHRLTA